MIWFVLRTSLLCEALRCQLNVCLVVHVGTGIRQFSGDGELLSLPILFNWPKKVQLSLLLVAYRAMEKGVGGRLNSFMRNDDPLWHSSTLPTQSLRQSPQVTVPSSRQKGELFG